MNSQFRPLFNHFFRRFFDRSTSEDSQPLSGIAQLLAGLSIPGLMISFFMMSDHPPGVTMFVTPAFSDTARVWLRMGDRYVFVSFAMIAMGILMALKWDSLFPDRQDYMVLTSLPISRKKWFAAKGLALCAFLGLFAIAINFFSMFIVPPLILGQNHATKLA